MESWLQRMMASRLPKFYEPCLAILLLAVEVFAGSRLYAEDVPQVTLHRLARTLG